MWAPRMKLVKQSVHLPCWWAIGGARPCLWLQVAGSMDQPEEVVAGWGAWPKRHPSPFSRNSFSWLPWRWRGLCFGRTLGECWWSGLRCELPARCRARAPRVSARCLLSCCCGRQSALTCTLLTVPAWVADSRWARGVYAAGLGQEYQLPQVVSGG